MILSILIPTYNWDATLLIQKLAEEIGRGHLPCPTELIVADDGSNITDIRDRNNRAIQEAGRQNVSAKYLQLPSNKGRAAVRNSLLSAAQGTHFILLDSDVLPDNDDFIARYCKAYAETGTAVLCGGRTYKTRLATDSKYDFHVYFGRATEEKSAATRNKHSWAYLYSTNIFISRELLTRVSFDERFTGWGYEDTDWAVRLTDVGRVLHIENTVSHLGLITKERVYQKNVSSIKNYCLFYVLHPKQGSEMSVHPYIKWISLLPLPVIRMAERIFRLLLFSQDRFHRMSYVLLQLSKACLLSMAVRKYVPKWPNPETQDALELILRAE